MIGIGGAIGSGLFLGSASRLHDTGPSLVLSYIACGIVAMIVVLALGEMVVHRPSSGAFVSYAREFIGEKGAFAAGWLHFVNWAFTLIADATAMAIFLSFWSPVRDALPQWALAAIGLGVVIVINLIGVKLFGELEFWFAIIKVGAIVSFMLVAIYFIVTGTDLGTDGQSATAGFHNITDSGFFPNGFAPVVVVSTGVIFSYAAMELIGVAAGETENPEKVMPGVVRSVIWRILLFYVGTMLLLCILLPTNQYVADVSPFVTVLDRVGFHLGGVHMADIMQVVLITAVASSMNSGLYSTGRVLRSMAMAGTAPRYLGKMNGNKVPYAAILTTAGFGAVGVLINFFFPSKAFEIVLEIASLGIIGVWSTILISHALMVRKAGRGEMRRPHFVLHFAPWINYLALAFLAAVILLIAFGDDPDAAKSAYIGVPGLLILFVGGWFLVRGNIDAEAFDEAEAEADEEQWT